QSTLPMLMPLQRHACLKPLGETPPEGNSADIASSWGEPAATRVGRAMRCRIARAAVKAIRPNMDTEAVVFDLFDTLVDWRDVQAEASRELAAQMGIEQDAFDERWH